MVTQCTHDDFLKVITLADRVEARDLPAILRDAQDEMLQLKLREQTSRFGSFALNHISIYPRQAYYIALNALYRKTERGPLPPFLAHGNPISAVTAKGTFYMSWKEADELFPDLDKYVEGYLVLDQLIPADTYRGLEATDFLMFTAPTGMKVHDFNNFQHPRRISIGTHGAHASKWTLHCLEGWP